MKNILLTGANGQLGNEFKKISKNFPDTRFLFTDIDELNITNEKALVGFFSDKRFDVLINCAAYTAVDKAEDEPERADLINRQAVKNLALICKEKNIRLIHFSTDFVFDGQKNIPYTETDRPAPVSVYGKTKLDGELEIINICTDYLIIRTSWLYSAFGNNFVKTIINKAETTGHLRVVYDQIGNPTHAYDLAIAVMKIIFHENYRKSGVYHFSGEGAVSWFDFACTIVELAGIACETEAVRSHEFVSKAVRPPYSVLDKTKIKNDFGIKIPWWQSSLKNCLKEMNILK